MLGNIAKVECFCKCLVLQSSSLLTHSRAGDAAHSFPPTGGLGLNSGLGDVHNLAYKLAAVYRGFAADNSLNSYEYDRRQVAAINSQQSLKYGKQIFGLLKAMGTTDSDVSKARENLYRNIEEPEIMTKIGESIEGQREHFDNLGLHIGYIYGNREIPENASVYEPSCTPGARLPHAWIKPLSPGLIKLAAIDSSYVTELSPEELQAKQFSTLDLCPFDAFTLIADESSSSYWEKIAQYLQSPELLSSSPNIQVVVEGRDFVVQPSVNGEKWIELMGLRKGQATLIRPDQHILECFGFDEGVPHVFQALSRYFEWDRMV